MQLGLWPRDLWKETISTLLDASGALAEYWLVHSCGVMATLQYAEGAKYTGSGWENNKMFVLCKPIVGSDIIIWNRKNKGCREGSGIKGGGRQGVHQKLG